MGHRIEEHPVRCSFLSLIAVFPSIRRTTTEQMVCAIVDHIRRRPPEQTIHSGTSAGADSSVWWQRRRVQRRDLLRTSPFFAMSLAMSAADHYRATRPHRTRPARLVIELCRTILAGGQNFLVLRRKALWPVNLMFVYPQWSLNTVSSLVWLPLLGAVAVAIGLWYWRRREWSTAAAFGLGYFAIALLPVLGFFDIYYFRYTFVGDHFQYLASIGPIALVTAAVAMFVKSRSTQAIATVVAITAFAGLSWCHAQTFHDDETLWRDTLSRNPDAAIAHNNLGIILDTEAQYESAVEQYREALAINRIPRSPRQLRIGIDQAQAVQTSGGRITRSPENQTRL